MGMDCVEWNTVCEVGGGECEDWYLLFRGWS